MALRTMPFTPWSVFYTNPSLQVAKRYTGTAAGAANANSRLSSMLQYILCVSRFAHYIKVMGRERLGSTMSAEECEVFLQDWLRGYCEGSDNASQEAKSRSPLREGLVQVREQPGKPGSYSCSVMLRPHFQLDDIATGFSLVTELAPPRAA
jgi:type VI secretion system protein ImpD